MDDSSIPADAWGITDGYHDIDGTWHPTSPETRRALREAMGDPEPGPPRWFVDAGVPEKLWNPADLVLEDGTRLEDVERLPEDLPLGWHALHPRDGGPTTDLVVVPSRGARPGRRRGVAVLAHQLWSDTTWHTGDLDDVAALSRRLIAAGGDTVLLGPLHARLPGREADPSPYSPSTRRWWDPLLARPADDVPVELAAHGGEWIDRTRVHDAAWEALAAEYALMTPDSDRERTWRRWAQDRGAELVRFARWTAVVERFGSDARRWPGDLATPSGPGWRRRFVPGSDLADRADFHAWCQWRVDAALRRVADTGVGLVTDLAVGFHPEGFDAWDLADVTVHGVSLGAPPDPFAPDGQRWALPPLDPAALSRARFEPWLAAIRTALAHARGLRIDHVIGLSRQFWIPPGGEPEHGAYVRQPRDALLALLTLEAHRHGAFVIGEDLGTVEPSMRAAMSRRGILGIRVGIFTDEAPETWPPDTLATVTTHDLPTMAGLLTSTETADENFRGRLRHLGATSPEVHNAIDAVHRRLLRAGSDIVLLGADDLCANPQRPNLPGVAGPPSWCTRLPVPVDRIPLEIFSSTDPSAPHSAS